MPALKLWDGAAWVAVGTAEGSGVMSQAEAESSTDTVARLTTGQRLYQAIQKHAPRGTLGVTQLTTQQTFATRNTIGLSVTVTVGTGRRIKITHDTQLSHGSSGVGSYIYTMEGATQLLRRSIIHGVSSFAEPCQGEVILTPTAGTHTYHLEGLSSGTCTVNAEVGSPSFILVEDIGT